MRSSPSTSAAAKVARQGAGVFATGHRLGLCYRAVVGARDRDRDGLGGGDVAVGYFVREGLNSALAVIQALRGFRDVEAVRAIGIDGEGAVLAVSPSPCSENVRSSPSTSAAAEVTRQGAGVFAARDRFRLCYRTVVGTGDRDRDGLRRRDVAVGHFVREGLDGALAIIQALRGLGDVEAVGAIRVHRQGAVLAVSPSPCSEKVRSSPSISVPLEVARQRAGVFAARHRLSHCHRAVVGTGDRDRDGLGGGHITVGYFVREGLDSALAVVEALAASAISKL